MKNIFLFLILFFSTSGFGQKEFTQNISGIIKDADTDLPLVGVSVYLLNTNPILGVSTDLDGSFILKNVKVGVYNIKISYLTHETQTINNVYLTSAKDLILNIKLKERAVSTEVVEINAVRNNEQVSDMATVSVHSISSLENNHFAGGIADPSRVVLSYAGIKAQGDLNNGISIRGNKPTNMLWQLEGIEIQDPNHFTLGSSFGGNYINGAVSAVSGSLLRNINLYTSAFPAEYGNALSGVMDLSLRNGNDKNFEYNFNIGMLGLEGTIEGPIEMGGSFLVSFRYSTLDLVSKMGFDVGNSKIGYRDVNYKINLPTKKMGVFTAFGIAGWSESSSLDFYKEKRTWNTTYNNAVFGFSHKINLSKKAFLKNIVAVSKVKTYYHFFYKLQANAVNFTEKEYYIRDESTLRYSLTLFNKFNTKNNLLSGLKVSHPKLNFSKGIDSEVNQQVYDKYENISFKNSSVYLQFFSQWKHRFNNRLSINTGLHYLLFTYNMNYSIEPRISLKWDLHKKHSINFGTGLHSQIEFLPIYMAKVFNYDPVPLETALEKDNFNKNLELSKSFHISANYNYKPFKDFSIKVEPYLQYHFHVPELTIMRYRYDYDTVLQKPILLDSIKIATTTLNNSTDLIKNKLTNEGVGLNYGVELTINKSFSKNYYFLVSGSLYRSFYKTSLDKTWQPTSFDGLFTFSASGGKDFIIGKKKQNLLSLNARFLWSGGYIKPNLLNEIGVNRYKNYYKLDTRLAYILNRKKFTFTVALDLLNTTNHKNETQEYLQNASGILPVLSFNFRFQQ